MKININDKNGVIDSAFIDEAGLSFGVFINTKYKGVKPYCTSSGEGRYTWYFHSDNESCLEDIVTLSAETEEDNNILDRLVFELHNKNQLWFLFLDNSVIGITNECT